MQISSFTTALRGSIMVIKKKQNIKIYFTVQLIFKILASDCKRNEKVILFFFPHQVSGLNLATNQRNLKFKHAFTQKISAPLMSLQELVFIPNVIIPSANKCNIISRRLAIFAF